MAESKAVWSVAASCRYGEPGQRPERRNRSRKTNEGVQVGVTGDFFSKYIWRGQNIVNNWVFQPGANVGYKPSQAPSGAI